MELNREMTSEEAIEWLVAIEEKYIHGGDEGFDNQRRTALHLARNALALIKQLTEDVEWSAKRILEADKKIAELTEKAQKDWEGYILTAELLYDAEQRCAKLTKENEDLKAIAEQYQKQFEDCANDRARLAEENERLRTSCTELTQCCTKLETLYKIECKRVDTIKADIVREMQERIKTRCIKSGIYPAIVARAIDQVAKEMTEEEQ